MKLITTKFKSGRLHEKLVVATWKLEIDPELKGTAVFRISGSNLPIDSA